MNLSLCFVHLDRIAIQSVDESVSVTLIIQLQMSYIQSAIGIDKKKQSANWHQWYKDMVNVVDMVDGFITFILLTTFKYRLTEIKT